MEILIKSIVISLFCVGLRITSGEGMILEWLRYPYVYLSERELNFAGKFLKGLLTPIIGCITCMSSFWGVLIDYYYFDNFNKWTILLIFVVSSLNTYIYKQIDK